ncbi:terpene synthase family protein, partial [Aspergillus homomorphus CBS 101889]
DTSQPHQAFRDSLRGQRVTIPSLHELFPEWMPRFHPDWQKARDEVLNPWLERWVEEPYTCAKLQAANFTIFAAIVCADASFDKLCTVAKYFAWYFVWDDPYQQKSKEYFEYTLLRRGSRPDLSSFTKGQQMALLCWDEVGEHIRRFLCSNNCQTLAEVRTFACLEVREILLETMLPFVESVDTVDSIYLHDNVPTVAEYWQRRDLTAAVYPVIATLFFIHDASTPVTSLKNPRLADLWKHTSYIVHITNDMLSMPKEAKDNQIEGLVPVLMMNYGIDCSTAMQWSFRLVQEIVKAIRDIERYLLEDTEKGEVNALLKKVFISGCKDVAMGLIHWR